jgi:hypothetical protein
MRFSTGRFREIVTSFHSLSLLLLSPSLKELRHLPLLARFPRGPSLVASIAVKRC